MNQLIRFGALGAIIIFMFAIVAASGNTVAIAGSGFGGMLGLLFFGGLFIMVARNEGRRSR